MKIQQIVFLFLSINFVYSQDTQQTPPNTEIYLFDLNIGNGKMILSNVKNISDNEGYDNQPHFLDDDYVLFSSNRNGQTDIAKYFMRYDSKTWLNFSPGSEYSPTKIPGQNAVSAIKLEADGAQKLNKYSLSTGKSELLIDDIVIGYQLWYDENTLISSVLENDMLNLYKTDMSTGTNFKLDDNVGRSLHKIPNSDLISYVSKSTTGQPEIKSMDLNSGKMRTIIKVLEGSEDFVWLNSGKIIMGKDNKLYINNSKAWKEWADLKQNGIEAITRIAINKDNTKLAVVGQSNGAIISNTDQTGSADNGTNNDQAESITESSTEAANIVQSHIEPFNKGNLVQFLEPFAENVVVGRFPAEVLLNGKDKMRQSYENYFKNNENLSVKVNKRIVLNNIVIDEELATQNMETKRQVTIYETAEDKIKSMVFIQNTDSSNNAEQLVNAQLKAYNNRDIDAFMATYSNDIKLYNYPNELRTEGADAVRNSYKAFFERTPDLRGIVQNRMLIGNKIIDHEHVTINGQVLNAIAIYEVENGRIVRVTFIQ